jgi:hypothetical protein
MKLLPAPDSVVALLQGGPLFKSTPPCEAVKYLRIKPRFCSQLQNLGLIKHLPCTGFDEVITF